MSRINSILSLAMSYIGTTEGSTAHKEIIRAYNRVKALDAYKMTVNDPWCAAFIVAIFAMCGFENLIPCYASCQQMIYCFLQMDRYYSNSDFSPKPGDIVFYNWDSNNKSDHVGLVTNNNGGALTVIEGNKSDKVAIRYISRDSSYIMGFARPDYEDAGYGANSVSYTDWFLSLGKYDSTTVKTLPLLKEGDKGVYVKILQLFLNVYGKAGLSIDGDFGNATKGAVKRWQKTVNLEQDGECGVQTWSSFIAK